VTGLAKHLTGAPTAARVARLHRIGVVVTRGFSTLEYGAVTEVLAAAGACDSASAVEIGTLSPGGGRVASTTGLFVDTAALPDAPAPREAMLRDLRLLVILSGPMITGDDCRALVPLVRAARRQRTETCATGGAIRCLAEQDLIAAATDHWDRLLPLRETFPDTHVVDAIFCRDGPITTCAGQAAMLDFALHWVAGTMGEDLSRHISNLMMVPYRRASEQAQPCDARSRYHGLPAHLTRVVQLMYDNLEEPLPLARIAAEVGVSGRQIERLTRRYLQLGPGDLYRSIRLDRALRLLRQTDLSVLQISVICGFSSLSTFNKNFKTAYGRSPQQERQGLSDP
jgi:transcriptional regulator GlxA family with amidase domain